MVFVELAICGKCTLADNVVGSMGTVDEFCDSDNDIFPCAHVWCTGGEVMEGIHGCRISQRGGQGCIYISSGPPWGCGTRIVNGQMMEGAAYEMGR